MSASATRSSACSPRQDFTGALRPVGGERCDDTLARRLRHRFPDPCPREGLRRAAEGLRHRARSPAQRGRQRDATSTKGKGEDVAYAHLCAGPQRPPGDGRSALSRRHQARRRSARPWPAAQLAAALALLGDKGRAADGVRLRHRPVARSAGRPLLRGPTTVRGCATAPASSRLPPNPALGATSCSGLAASSTRRAARARIPPARRKMPGWCWPPRRVRATARRWRSRSTA